MRLFTSYNLAALSNAETGNSNRTEEWANQRDADFREHRRTPKRQHFCVFSMSARCRFKLLIDEGKTEESGTDLVGIDKWRSTSMAAKSIILVRNLQTIKMMQKTVVDTFQHVLNWASNSSLPRSKSYCDVARPWILCSGPVRPPSSVICVGTTLHDYSSSLSEQPLCSPRFSPRHRSFICRAARSLRLLAIGTLSVPMTNVCWLSDVCFCNNVHKMGTIVFSRGDNCNCDRKIREVWGPTISETE